MIWLVFASLEFNHMLSNLSNVIKGRLNIGQVRGKGSKGSKGMELKLQNKRQHKGLEILEINLP